MNLRVDIGEREPPHGSGPVAPVVPVNPAAGLLPAFDRPVGDLEQGGRDFAGAFAVAAADFGENPGEFSRRLHPPQSVLEIFRNPEPCTVPAGEFAKQNASVLLVITDHQPEVPLEERDLFIG